MGNKTELQYALACEVKGLKRATHSSRNNEDFHQKYLLEDYLFFPFLFPNTVVTHQKLSFTVSKTSTTGGHQKVEYIQQNTPNKIRRK